MAKASNSNPNKFNVGDLVQLKSGGPVMTVNSIWPNGTTLQCVWFAGKKNVSATFDHETLLPAKADEK